MTAINERFNVFPTRMSQQHIKGKLKVAERGHGLLKSKSDVLSVKFREVGQEVIEIKYMMGRVMKEAAYLLAETKYLTGDISNDILGRVNKARLKVRSKFENIAGVQIRIFQCYEAGEDEFGLTGLAKGGERLHQLKRVYTLATDILVQMATLQCAFKTLDEVIKATNRRVNALEYRYIPKCKNTLDYITDYLDENERQDFYRMKMVQNMKKVQQVEKEKARDDRKTLEIKETEDIPDTEKQAEGLKINETSCDLGKQ